ncbi:MAG: hypothetical protein PsegKO_15850 [Pseudohongiellaceae bacterium]
MLAADEGIIMDWGLISKHARQLGTPVRASLRAWLGVVICARDIA